MLQNPTNEESEIKKEEEIIAPCGFGHENLDYVKNNTELMEKCLNELTINAMYYIAKDIYYNIDHPENRTVFLHSIKNQLLRVFIDGEWTLMSFHQVIPKMMRVSLGILCKEFYNYYSLEMTRLLALPDGDRHYQQELLTQKQEYVSNLLKDNTKAFRQTFNCIKAMICNHKFNKSELVPDLGTTSRFII
jgi:hypothetical protein